MTATRKLPLWTDIPGIGVCFNGSRVRREYFERWIRNGLLPLEFIKVNRSVTRGQLKAALIEAGEPLPPELVKFANGRPKARSA